MITPCEECGRVDFLNCAPLEILEIVGAYKKDLDIEFADEESKRKILELNHKCERLQDRVNNHNYWEEIQSLVLLAVVGIVGMSLMILFAMYVDSNYCDDAIDDDNGLSNDTNIQ